MEAPLDALVIGGGPAGSTAAALLALCGWRVGLVESATFPRRKVCGEFLSASSWEVLEELGVAQAFFEKAGPEVSRLGLFEGETTVLGNSTRRPGCPWGRALSRERLDPLLLDRSIAAGVTVWQPWTAVALESTGDRFACRLVSRERSGAQQVFARIIIAAHGSWQPGTLPTQCAGVTARAGDLLAFKAHFFGSRLPAGLMPLLAFPGGYGGMVHVDEERVSFSLCVRRDQLARCRQQRPGHSAGDAVFQHVQGCCQGVRETLANASLDGTWLGAGPIRPGVRTRVQPPGIFVIGNAAGEAHPAIAEGITMAIRSAGLLCEVLASGADVLGSAAARVEVGREYEAAWQREFGRRIALSRAVAWMAMGKWVAKAGRECLRRWPQLLEWGAQLSGKISGVRTSW